MKLNKNSFVYKLLKQNGCKSYLELKYDNQTNLCTIIKDLLILFGLFMLGLFTGLAILIFFLAVLYSVTLAPLLDVWIPGTDGLLIVTLICCICTVLGFVILHSLGYYDTDIDSIYPKYLQRWLKLGEYKEDKVVNTSSLWYIVSTWLKDRKDKLCRIVSLED